MKQAGAIKRDLEGRQSGSASDSGAGHRRMAYGGKTIYGARIGILMLDMEIPRIPGDMGNAGTWPFPVLFKTVRGANRNWIHEAPREDVFRAFRDDALDLVAQGADGLAVCCGMMSLYQEELADSCQVPVVTSSLIQVPFVERLLSPGKRVGILTISTNLLKPKHLEAAGVAPDTPIIGFEDSDEFVAMRQRENPIMDVAKVEREALAIAKKLVSDHPDLGALVMECTNLPPFSRAISEATGLPVYDIYNFLCWFHAGLAPRDFGHPGSAPRNWRER
jgi:aspartate/glutamate racemase